MARHSSRRTKRRNHQYITSQLAGASVYDIAANCRTSVMMIEQHYARWLAPSDLAINVTAAWPGKLEDLLGRKFRRAGSFNWEGPSASPISFNRSI